MANKKHYTYMITLDAPMWPRKLADELSYVRGIAAHLVSVTDVQNHDHVYGATYPVRDRDGRPAEGGVHARA